MIDETETKTREESPRPVVDASPQQSGQTLAESARPTEARKFRSGEKKFFPQKTPTKLTTNRIIGGLFYVALAVVCVGIGRHIKWPEEISAYNKGWGDFGAGLFLLLAFIAVARPKEKKTGLSALLSYFGVLGAVVAGMNNFYQALFVEWRFPVAALDALCGVMLWGWAASYWIDKNLKFRRALQGLPLLLAVVMTFYVGMLPEIVRTWPIGEFRQRDFITETLLGLFLGWGWLLGLISLEGDEFLDEGRGATNAPPPENKGANSRKAIENEKAALL